jgi:hypothetical protein
MIKIEKIFGRILLHFGKILLQMRLIKITISIRCFNLYLKIISLLSGQKNFLLELPKHEKSIYSQHEQDGILEKLFQHLPLQNNPPVCVEFGFSSTDQTLISNTANLVLNKGWKALLLDGGRENKKINLHKEFITSENICDLFRKYNIPKKPDYVSIDIDSTDLWILKSILVSYKPSVLTIEYNSQFPVDVCITFPNNPDEFWEYDTVYGCSIGCINLVAQKYGYQIVYVGATDVYLVSSELINGLKPLTLTYFSKIAKRAPLRVHKPCTTGREKIMLDYSVWLKTNSVEEAQKAAKSYSVKYLT